MASSAARFSNQIRYFMLQTAKPATTDSEFRIVRIAAPLRQSVVESIRNAITTGHFAPGERLTEKELCEMIGVSRTIVREALRQLESEGLIDVVPHRGPVVAKVSLAQAEQIYQVRKELEGLAAELFAQRASEDQVKELKALLKELKASNAADDRVTRLSIKNRFYACLLRGAGNDALRQVFDLLNTRVTLLRVTSLLQKGRLQKSLSELTALVDAIATGDAKAARSAAEAHVTNAADAALKVLRESGE